MSVAQFPPIATGSGTTITTAAPLSGNGSAGSPATIGAATTSTAGSMSAADKAFLVNRFAWQESAVAFLKAKVPTLTGFKPIEIGVNPMSMATGVPVQDLTKEGGFMGAASATTRLFSAAIINTQKTGKWGFVCRAFLNAPVSGRQHQFGLGSSLGGEPLSIFNSVFANSTTHYQLAVGAASPVTGTFVSDGNVHDFCIVGDGTNVTSYIDGVQDAQIAQTNAQDNPSYLFAFNTTLGDVGLYEAVIGFVAP